jgi:hypothetical protein
MKKLLSVFGILALCLTFAGCDKEEGEESNKLVGIWELVSLVSEESDEGEDASDYLKGWLVFNTDASAVMYSVYEQEGWYEKEEGVYRVDGNKITIAGEEGELVKLTSSELILKYTDIEYSLLFTFKKVSTLPDFGQYEEHE